ncbi:MAG: DUF2752 domain-containing protein [Deltaproteobacteria bacterium]|nr:DUF2752 domain-containing protein [Deltaproteobacteria bacterium]
MPQSISRRLMLMAMLLGPLLAILLAPQAPECAWRQLMGLPCPGCGLGHALAALGQGDLLQSCSAYPPLPVLVLLWALSLHLLIKGSNRFLPWAAGVVALVVMGNWTLKLAA